MSWQPIEKAPRDGTKILAHAPNEWAEVVYFDHGDGWCNDDGEWLESFKPTHWMPLPPPPPKDE